MHSDANWADRDTLCCLVTHLVHEASLTAILAVARGAIGWNVLLSEKAEGRQFDPVPDHEPEVGYVVLISVNAD